MKMEKIDIFYNRSDLIFEPKLFFKIHDYYNIGSYNKMVICFYNNDYYSNFINDINQLFSYIYNMNKSFISSLNMANNINILIDFNDDYREKYIFNVFVNKSSKFYNYKNQSKININELKNQKDSIYPIIQIKNLIKNKRINMFKIYPNKNNV